MIQDLLFKEIKDRDIFTLAGDYGSDYIERVFERRVYPAEDDLDSLANFEEELPEGFTSSEEILNRLNRYGSPATVAQAGGRYFGFVNGSVVPAGLAARIMTDFWDQNTAMQVISPVSAKLESVTEKWLKDIFGFPESTVAGFVSGTSMATFCGLAAARYRVLKWKGWDINESGMCGAPEVRVVAGSEAHSTVLKAVALLGFGRGNIEWAGTDGEGRIVPEKLPPLDDSTILILQAGNVNTGSYADFRDLCGKAKEAGAWVHIDGAFGLWAAAADKLKYLTDGIELADSWSVDGHKTLNTPYDNGIILCRDGDALVSALHMSGAYIVTGEDRDGMFYTPEMSRRARIIELWATMKSLGKKGIDEMVLGLHLRAKQFADELEIAGFDIINDVCFNQVLVYYANNEKTLKLLKKVQDMGVCWCGGSKWKGRDVIRISVCSWATTERDVTMSVQSFVEARGIIERGE